MMIYINVKDPLQPEFLEQEGGMLVEVL